MAATRHKCRNSTTTERLRPTCRRTTLKGRITVVAMASRILSPCRVIATAALLFTACDDDGTYHSPPAATSAGDIRGETGDDDTTGDSSSSSDSGGDSSDSGDSESPAPAPTSPTPGDDDATTGQAADDSSTGANDSGADDTTTGESECRPLIDVVLSIDSSAGMMWPLRRLASDIVAANAQLGNADVRWSLVVFADAVFADDVSHYGNPNTFAAATATDWWGGFANDQIQPTFEGGPNLEPADNGLGALAMIAALGDIEQADDNGAPGWRSGALRFVVHVTDSPIAEAPAVLSGFPVTATYTATVEALQQAHVHALTWTPTGTPGYSESFSSIPSIAQATGGAWFDLADESAPGLEPAPQFDSVIVNYIAVAVENDDGDFVACP